MDESLIDTLGDMVVSRFRKAREAKMPHYNDMMDCLKLMNGQPLSAPSGDGPDIVMDISSPIVKNIVGLIRDIFVGSTAQPYTINATPVVELPEDVEAQLLEKIERELETFITINGGDVNAVRAQVTEMRAAVQLEENRKANVAAERLRTIIADRLYDADWEAQFIDFIDHFCIYPAAIMKAPAVNTRTVMRWDGTTVSPTTETVRQVENISPFDFFPAPYATDIQSADYVIERRRLTRNELLQLGGASGYDVDVIAEVFEANPNGAPLPYGSVDDDDISDTDIGDKTDMDAFDALGYYGRIRNDLLAEYGIEFAEEEMHGASEAEVWVVGGRVIKCLLNPDPLGRRPFFKACFEKVPSSFWGASPAMKLRDTQRVCTASVRALVRNMQYSSGPIGEVRKGAVKDGHAPNAIIPHTIRVVEEDNFGNGAPAYRFYTVPSLSNELVALFDKFMGYGYELIGIPRVAFGSPQGLGTLGRTAGGVSIILNQSTKAIKQALRMIESGLIEPVVQEFINYEIRTSNDPDIRGDIRVYARGVSGLMEQESKNGDLEWALQSISSMVGVVDPTTGQPIVPATAVQRILYTMFKNKGLSTEGIFPDFDRQEAFGEIAGTPMPQDPAAGVPDLQGRSPNAEAAIAAANGV